MHQPDLARQLARYEAVLHEIHGALLLAQALNDAETRVVILAEIWNIVAAVLVTAEHRLPPHRQPANEWEG